MSSPWGLALSARDRVFLLILFAQFKNLEHDAFFKMRSYYNNNEKPT